MLIFWKTHRKTHLIFLEVSSVFWLTEWVRRDSVQATALHVPADPTWIALDSPVIALPDRLICAQTPVLSLSCSLYLVLHWRPWPAALSVSFLAWHILCSHWVCPHVPSIRLSLMYRHSHFVSWLELNVSWKSHSPPHALPQSVSWFEARSAEYSWRTRAYDFQWRESDILYS